MHIHVQIDGAVQEEMISHQYADYFVSNIYYTLALTLTAIWILDKKQKKKRAVPPFNYHPYYDKYLQFINRSCMCVAPSMTAVICHQPTCKWIYN